MSSLRDMQLQRVLKEGTDGDLKEGTEIPQIRDPTHAELNRAWQKLIKPIAQLAEVLANIPDSLDAATEFQRLLPRDVLTEMAPMTPEQVLEFRGQLRQLWEECEALSWKNEPMSPTVQKLLDNWWLAHDLYNRARWTVHFPSGTMFPTFLNFHALFARALFDNWIHLGICLNCKKRFYKPLRKSKYCKDCHPYDNRKRQQQLRARRKQLKATHNSKGRKS